jgi:hypothetical protein
LTKRLRRSQRRSAHLEPSPQKQDSRKNRGPKIVRGGSSPTRKVGKMAQKWPKSHKNPTFSPPCARWEKSNPASLTLKPSHVDRPRVGARLTRHRNNSPNRRASVAPRQKRAVFEKCATLRFSNRAAGRSVCVWPLILSHNDGAWSRIRLGKTWVGTLHHKAPVQPARRTVQNGNFASGLFGPRFERDTDKWRKA